MIKYKNIETGTIFYNHEMLKYYILGSKTDINGNVKKDILLIDPSCCPVFRKWIYSNNLKERIINMIEQMEKDLIEE